MDWHKKQQDTWHIVGTSYTDEEKRQIKETDINIENKRVFQRGGG